MKRQMRTTVAAIVCVSAGFFGPPVTARADAVVLKVSHFLPPDHSIHQDLVQWGDALKEKSKGQLVLEIFPAGKMAPPDKQYDLAQSGAADMALSLHAYTPGKFPMTEIAQLPFVMRASAAAGSAKLTELAPKYLEREYPRTKILFLLTSPPLKTHLARKRVESLDSFKGMRLRVSGEKSAETVKALRAIPVALAPGKTSEAMKRGDVDGAVFPFEATKSFNIGAVSKFSLEPGFNVVTFFLVMNRNSYDKLPASLQKAIDDTTGPQAARAFGAHLDDQEEEGKKYMVSNGVEIVVLPRSVMSRIEATTARYSDRVLAELNKQGLPAYKFYVEMLSANQAAKQ